MLLFCGLIVLLLLYVRLILLFGKFMLLMMFVSVCGGMILCIVCLM